MGCNIVKHDVEAWSRTESRPEKILAAVVRTSGDISRVASPDLSPSVVVGGELEIAAVRALLYLIS